MFNTGLRLPLVRRSLVVMHHSSAFGGSLNAHFSPYQADNSAHAMQYGRHFVSNHLMDLSSARRLNPKSLISAARASVVGLFPLGIAARMTIALASVAILAIAANIVGQKSVSYVRTHSEAASPAVPEAPVKEVVAAVAAPPPPPPPPAAIRPAPDDHVRVKALALAIDRFQHASEMRTQSDSSSANGEYVDAANSLLTFANSPFAAAGHETPAAAKAAARHIQNFARQAQALVSEADERREARASYLRTLDSLNTVLQKSLDGAWKILGRVIARQSLLQLRENLDEIRQHSEVLRSGDISNASMLEGLVASESAFQKILTAQQAALTKSEGAPWVQEIQSDITLLVSLREQLVSLATQEDESNHDLAKERQALTAAVSEALVAHAAPVLVAAPASSSAPNRVAASGPMSKADARAASALAAASTVNFSAAVPVSPATPSFGAAAVPLAAPAVNATTAIVPMAPSVPNFGAAPTAESASDVIPGGSAADGATPGTDSGLAEPTPVADTVVTTETRVDRAARITMAVVTLVTLLIATIVCILTVRSVVRPVRRFLHATTLLAQGNDRVQVPPGGIRELDTLANAFNEMARQLAAERLRTRRQTDELEATVVERTAQLQKLAEEDPLTSLPNRRHLQALLTNALGDAARKACCVGVYFVDIDNFKNFNDSLGHVFGDRVLMSVANRLEELMDGHGFVARLGGDEFTAVYCDAPSVEAIKDLGQRIVNAFYPLLLVDEREFSVSVSVGASVYPEHESNAEGLLRAADSALFKAKESGRSQLVMFTSELIESAAARFATEQGLRHAIDRQEFLLMYQPEVNLSTFKIGLVEALIRWQRPDGRLAYPGEFLAVAEQSSLVSEINEWVMRAAVADASKWHHGSWPDVRVAINISPRQLMDRRFTERLLMLLEEYRLPTRCIELELTETVLQTGQLTIDTLRILRSHGIGIALDDFGTGFSSITSLQELPLTRVKLDRSLIATIDSSERAAVITHSIIQLCSGLELEVTAEGIERPEQLAWLLNQSPMFLQGYLLARPLVFAEISKINDLMPQKMQDLVLSMSPGSRRREAPADELLADVIGSRTEALARL
jgi:diguanylate cyclase (GGDEF)-like protein